MNKVQYAVMYTNKNHETIPYGIYQSFNLALDKKKECDKNLNVISHVAVIKFLEDK